MLKEFDISKNANDLKNFKNFIKILILDISPCLQKGIITVLIEFFRKPTPSSELILEHLINSSLIDYLLFNYSIALIDVRCFILAFLKVILNYKVMKDEKNISTRAQITNKIIPFLFENLFPNNLKAFKKNVLKSQGKVKVNGMTKNNVTNKKFMKGLSMDFDFNTEKDLKFEDANSILKVPSNFKFYILFHFSQNLNIKNSASPFKEFQHEFKYQHF